LEDLADALYTTPEMAALFSGAGHVRRMLDFEGALARAEARAGVIPAGAAEAISAACRVELFDVPALLRDTAVAGTLAIPLAKALTAQVGGEAARYVHWGATSQDVIDTALVLQMRDGLDLLLAGLLDIAASCAQLAERHRGTPMAGRTLLQQALPITFGLRAARWLSMIVRQYHRLKSLRDDALALQFGGAAGTLASLGSDGARVAELLAEELDLSCPDLPWHGERDRVAEIAAALGIVAGAVGKIAQDILLLSQTELGEVAEGAAPGKGGSSTLPHKRNPVDTVAAIAAARLAQSLVPVVLASMIQEHERAVGGWQSEWTALPEIFRYTAGAVDRVRLAVANLEVDAERMRSNLDLTRGLLMAESLSMTLASTIGKLEAHHVVQAACERAVRADADLGTVARSDDRISSALSTEEIDRALDPIAYLGTSDLFVDRAVAAFRAISAPFGTGRGAARSAREE
jgi:3-carboxy-cis,cis-muconate cycloisomerase